MKQIVKLFIPTGAATWQSTSTGLFVFVGEHNGKPLFYNRATQKYLYYFKNSDWLVSSDFFKANAHVQVLRYFYISFSQFNFYFLIQRNIQPRSNIPIRCWEMVNNLTAQRTTVTRMWPKFLLTPHCHQRMVKASGWKTKLCLSNAGQMITSQSIVPARSIRQVGQVTIDKFFISKGFIRYLPHDDSQHGNVWWFSCWKLLDRSHNNTFQSIFTLFPRSSLTEGVWFQLHIRLSWWWF